jgi:DNA polymerase elongation subunit (family B)
MTLKLVRRDISPFTVKTYNKILTMILNNCSRDEAKNLLEYEIQKLKDGRVPISDLTINKTLRTYRSDTFYLKAFVDKIGMNAKPGDVISYVIVRDPSSHLVDKMRLTENNFDPLDIDYDYYVEKELLKRTNELFRIAFPE